jgi:hypothetical protein
MSGVSTSAMGTLKAQNKDKEQGCLPVSHEPNTNSSLPITTAGTSSNSTSSS